MPAQKKRPRSFSGRGLAERPGPTHLPSLGTFLGELGKVDGLLGVLLPVFLSTRLDEEGVRRCLPLRLVDVFTHHSGSLKDGQVDRQTDGNDDRRTDGREDRQVDRQTDVRQMDNT